MEPGNVVTHNHHQIHNGITLIENLMCGVRLLFTIPVHPWALQTPILMDIDEKKNDTCRVCTLTKLTMILAYDLCSEQSTA